MIVAFSVLCCAVPTFGFVRVLALHADTPRLRRRRIVALENINRRAPDTRLQRSEARTGMASPLVLVRARSHSHHPLVRLSGDARPRRCFPSPARPLSRGGLT